MAAPPLPFRKRVPLALLSLAAATAVWLPALGLLYRPSVRPYFTPRGIAPKARKLAARHLRLWTEPRLRERELARMRGSNAEWDFMGRTFLVLALSNMALAEPAREAECLAVVDRVIDETLRLEREKGLFHFLMPYARGRPFVQKPARSQFLDGEIALMLAARRAVAEKAAYKPLLAERVGLMAARMTQSPVLCAESYPDECWTFCNAVALAAIRMADHLDGTDHSALFRQWLATAKEKLLDPETGLLVSSFSLRGRVQDGPEGSTIWLAAHCLQLVDGTFAADQYARARKELGRSLLGFGYAREWPRSWRGPQDIDSGPVVPVLEASASSSGLAFIAARAFGDREFYAGLLASLEFAGMPVERDGALTYCASNQVGDAVLLYSMVLGPLWAKVKAGGAE